MLQENVLRVILNQIGVQLRQQFQLSCSLIIQLPIDDCIRYITHWIELEHLIRLPEIIRFGFLIDDVVLVVHIAGEQQTFDRSRRLIVHVPK